MTTLSLQPNLDRLFKIFSDNQAKMERLKNSGVNGYSEGPRYH